MKVIAAIFGCFLLGGYIVAQSSTDFVDKFVECLEKENNTNLTAKVQEVFVGCLVTLSSDQQIRTRLAWENQIHQLHLQRLRKKYSGDELAVRIGAERLRNQAQLAAIAVVGLKNEGVKTNVTSCALSRFGPIFDGPDAQFETLNRCLNVDLIAPSSEAPVKPA